MIRMAFEVAISFLKREPHEKVSHTASCGNSLTLHGNIIAWWHGDSIKLTLAGYPSGITRDRLNNICMLHIGAAPFHQKGRQQYFYDDPISSDQIITLTKLKLED